MNWELGRGRAVARIVGAVVVCAVIGLAFGAGPAFGKKKKPPTPPPPPPADDTTIFVRCEYYQEVQLWSMDGNGGDVTLLVDELCGDPSVAQVYGRASNDAHGGHYWFARLCPVGGTCPDGYVRRELFAVRDDGLSVQITNDPAFTFPPESQTGWKPGDGAISCLGLVWSADGSTVAESGLYEIPVSFDASGDVTGASGAPTQVVGSTAFVRPDGFWRTDLTSFHDWSPTADRVVVTRFGSQVYVYDVDTGSETSLGSGFCPDWSPDGDRIAMASSGIVTIDPDGTDRTVLIANVSKKNGSSWATLPFWSPDSSRILYQWTVNGRTGATVDLYRMDASGSNKVNLTPDAWVGSPEAWR